MMQARYFYYAYKLYCYCVEMVGINRISSSDSGDGTTTPISPTILHSAVDEEDFSGVVDGPALKVSDVIMIGSTHKPCYNLANN